MRRISTYLAVAALTVSAALYWRTDLRSFVSDLVAGEPAAPDFTLQCLQGLNERRSRVGQPELNTDPALQSSLEGFLASLPNGSDVDLDLLLQHLQRSYPNVTALSATLVWHPTSSGLAKGISSWQDGVGRQFETLSTVTFRDGYRRGCIGVLAHRLPLFDLTSANRDGGRYHHDCPRCGAGHAIELERSARTVQLRCPHCRRPYDILASDSLGEFHRAPSFLTGFRLPESIDLPEHNEAEQVIAVWQLITSNCRYVSDGDDGGHPASPATPPSSDSSNLLAPAADHSGKPTSPTANGIAIHSPAQNLHSRAEAWQTPAETWLRRAGDCEDTSLLLADVLIGLGFDARVALGWNAQGGDHAWCVVQLSGGDQYILESTIEPQGKLRLLPVSEAHAAYRPEQLFDRDHLYFPNSATPASDYWSEDIWTSVRNQPPPHRTAQRNEKPDALSAQKGRAAITPRS